MFFKELKTDRLLLRNLAKDDAAFLLKEFSNPKVNAHLFDTEPLSTIEEANRIIDFYLEEEPRCQHRWILVLKDTGEAIGTCGFHRWHKENATVEMGYDLQPAYWNRGYMTEALSEILSFAKKQMQVKTIEAHIAEGNIASERIVKKLGFMKSDVTYYEVFKGEKYLHSVYVKLF
jgi:ribosomal-protein-alanine N-acetyltransferase